MTIAHGLSTILDAEQIAGLDYGSIVEVGPHEELFRRDDAYAAPVAARADSPVDEYDDGQSRHPRD